jgi:DNA-binding PadR family transcriptional regulator
MRLSYTGLKILQVCAASPGRTFYGYELMQATGAASGTLYPILMRFESEGWLASSWEKADPAAIGRPRRRLYRITGAGQRATADAMCGLVGASA